MFKIAVLISGTGTTLSSILRDAEKDELYDVSLVIADRNCSGLDYAKERGIPYLVMERSSSLSDDILGRVRDFDLVVLAGFLSILEGKILKEMENRIINLHPSLLPKFGGRGMYGLNVHKAVHESGMPISGCTVHYVNEIIDGGAYILKRIIGIKKAEGPEDIMHQVSLIEKGALIDAIRLIAKEEKTNESTDQCLRQNRA